jgi:hypothetical protein
LNLSDGLIKFTSNLKNEKSYFYEPTLALLSPDLKEQVLKEVENLAN